MIHLIHLRHWYQKKHPPPIYSNNLSYYISLNFRPSPPPPPRYSGPKSISQAFCITKQYIAKQYAPVNAIFQVEIIFKQYKYVSYRFIFVVLQHFLSSGSFAAQSLYSASFSSYRHCHFVHACNISVKQRPDYVHFLVTILNSSERNEHNKCLILWHKRFDLTKQFLSCGDKKSDYNRQQQRDELRYVAMKCDKAQGNLVFWR